MPRKPKLAIDFDGTLFDGKWTGINEVKGQPHPELSRILHRLAHKYDIVVFSCRAVCLEGRVAIRKWMNYHALPFHEITDVKPHAVAYIDDKAY